MTEDELLEAIEGEARGVFREHVANALEGGDARANRIAHSASVVFHIAELVRRLPMPTRSAGNLRILRVRVTDLLELVGESSLHGSALMRLCVALAEITHQAVFDADAEADFETIARKLG